MRTCSYELAERAEELGIITSVVGAHDLVPRVSWRALSYLKLLVRKALDETSMKKVSLHCVYYSATKTLCVCTCMLSARLVYMCMCVS